MAKPIEATRELTGRDSVKFNQVISHTHPETKEKKEHIKYLVTTILAKKTLK